MCSLRGISLSVPVTQIHLVQMVLAAVRTAFAVIVLLNVERAAQATVMLKLSVDNTELLVRIPAL
jgi:hypothetical protein